MKPWTAAVSWSRALLLPLPERMATRPSIYARERRTKVKAAWYLEGARQGLIPHHRLGRYVRFKFDEVLACSRFREKGK